MEDIQFTVLPPTSHTSEALELVTTQGVQPLMPGGVLHEPGLVTESVVAVLPHAVEMCLMFPVVTVGKLTVFIKSVITNMLQNNHII